jgi:hypothetical protein
MKLLLPSLLLRVSAGAFLFLPTSDTLRLCLRMIGKNQLEFFAYHFFASQDVEIVLGEAVGLVPDVLQQLAGG